MKAIVNTAPGKLEMLDWPTPSPRRGQVRVRTAACGICATDLAMIAGWQRTSFPAIPGHEWAGVIDAAGEGVPESLVGKRCVAENVLADGGEVGFEHPGGYAEYLLTEAANVQVLAEDFAMDVAALIEPLAVSVRALRRLRPEAKTPALILGDGPIGLMLVLLLARAGAGAIALVGGRDERLALARRFGASAVANYHSLGDLAAGVAAAIGRDFPNIIEASGSSAAMEAALGLAARGGKVLVVGDYGAARAGFAWNMLLHRELELIGTNASAGAWPEAAGLAHNMKDDLSRLISHRLPAGDFARGIEWMRAKAPGVLKVVLEW